MRSRRGIKLNDKILIKRDDLEELFDGMCERCLECYYTCDLYTRIEELLKNEDN